MAEVTTFFSETPKNPNGIPYLMGCTIATCLSLDRWQTLVRDTWPGDLAFSLESKFNVGGGADGSTNKESPNKNNLLLDKHSTIKQGACTG